MPGAGGQACRRTDCLRPPWLAGLRLRRIHPRLSNGAVLEGITGLSKAFPEEELDILLQNGVAVLEMRAAGQS